MSAQLLDGKVMSEELRARIAERVAALKEKTEQITGAPKKLPRGDKAVANVIYRDGTQIDTIYNVPQR